MTDYETLVMKEDETSLDKQTGSYGVPACRVVVCPDTKTS